MKGKEKDNSSETKWSLVHEEHWRSLWRIVSRGTSPSHPGRAGLVSPRRKQQEMWPTREELTTTPTAHLPGPMWGWR